MFRWLESRILWGTLLILGGVIFLLQNLGIIEFSDLFWALLLAVGGAFFFSVFLQNRGNWWALIPSFTLFSVALLVALGRLLPAVADAVGGSIVLGGIGLSFLIIYMLDRSNWWAIIPAGVMLTLMVVAGVSELAPGLESGGILFLGLGLTFGFLAILPTPEGRMRWALIPAGVLLVMGLLLMAAAGELIGAVWPLFLIAAGGYLLIRAFRPA